MIDTIGSYFTFYKQYYSKDCGPTCLRMVAKHYGKIISVESLRQHSGFSKEGISLLGIAKAAEKIGFSTRVVTLSYQELVNDIKLPDILH